MTWAWDKDTLAALETFLASRDLLAGAANPRPIGDGHSNLTYLIDVRGGRAVLRRPPPPPVPKGANDVLREARVLGALEGQGIPTPAVLAVARAGEVLDVPFYIMEHVPGVIMTDRLAPGIDAARDGEALAFGLIDALTRLHGVDWRARGLGDFGKPEDFNARHLRRIEGLMLLRDGPAPGWLTDMAARLKQRIPPVSGAAIVHNDFRLGNVIWSQSVPPRLLAVLDWELATLGDPLLDLGYLVCCHPAVGEELNPTQQLSSAMLQDGFPDTRAIIARYAANTGRDVSRIGWYAAMAAWKLAVLYDYQHRLARDAYYDDATQAPRFIASADAFLRLD